MTRQKLSKLALYCVLGSFGLYFLLRPSIESWSGDGCPLLTQTSPDTEGPVSVFLYRHILAHETPAPSGDVSVVAIEAGMTRLQQNVCPARDFMADTLMLIAAQHPAVIVIDKSFSDVACAPNDPGTLHLQSVISSLAVPVVVGQATEGKTDQASKTCQVLSPHLNLGPRVHYGLLRANKDLLKIPLVWPVVQNTHSAQLADGPARESLSYVAAEQAKPALSGTLEGLAKGPQPFANLKSVLDRQTTAELFCSANTTLAGRWDFDCKDRKSPPSLTNKTVVIGAESETDHPDVLSTRMYGFDLQAQYIAALLAGSYLRPLPPLVLLAFLTIFGFLQDFFILEAYERGFLRNRLPALEPVWSRLQNKEHPVAWISAVNVLIFSLVGLIGPLICHRFPPLGALLAILLSALASSFPFVTDFFGGDRNQGGQA